MTVKWFIHMWMLGMCSVEDCKEKRISLWKIKLYAVLIFAYEIWYRAGQGEEWSKWMLWCLMGILPGTAMLVISKVSKETIGYGDGYLTLILGFSIGFWVTLGVLGIAFLGAMGAAIYLIIIRRRSRNSEIAFVPFLFLGMAGTGLWKGM